jgi:hypothetical protein
MNVHRARQAVSLCLSSSLTLVFVGALASCDEDDDEAVVTDDYAYDYYYAADLAASDVPWTNESPSDPDVYHSLAQGERLKPMQRRAADGGAARSHGAGAVIRALARGDDVCGTHVSVTVKMVDAPCAAAGGPAAIRGGVSIVFDDCTLADGARLDGSFDVESSHRADDCQQGTVVRVIYTSTLTNFTYVAPNGGRVVIPAQTNSGSYTRPIAGTPAELTVLTNGTIQRYTSSGKKVADYTHSGKWEYAFSSDSTAPSYTLDGALTLEAADGQPTSIASDRLKRTAGCCQPSGGRILLTGSERDTDTWSFGAQCGAVAKNDEEATASECR